MIRNGSLIIVFFLLFWQGDARYPLLGQPLQYNPQIRPPLLRAPSMVTNHQVSLTKHAAIKPSFALQFKSAHGVNLYSQSSKGRWRAFERTCLFMFFLPQPHLLSSFIQGPVGIRHGGRGRKGPRKALSTDLSVGEAHNGRTGKRKEDRSIDIGLNIKSPSLACSASQSFRPNLKIE